MIFNNKFENITLATDGLILSYKAGTKKEILFSELDQIYFTANKIKPVYGISIILSSICIAVFSFLYLQIIMILVVPFLIAVAIIIQKNKLKRYELTIRLKNGETFNKQVPLKLKHETIDIANEVRKEIYNYKIKN